MGVVGGFGAAGTTTVARGLPPLSSTTQGAASRSRQAGLLSSGLVRSPDSAAKVTLIELNPSASNMPAALQAGFFMQASIMENKTGPGPTSSSPPYQNP